jgi:hypothetical protein
MFTHLLENKSNSLVSGQHIKNKLKVFDVIA